MTTPTTLFLVLLDLAMERGAVLSPQLTAYLAGEWTLTGMLAWFQTARIADAVLDSDVAWIAAFQNSDAAAKALDADRELNATVWASEARVRDHGRRIRARTIDRISLLRAAAINAQRTNRPAIVVRHGGSVANSYGYSADTECGMAIAWPDGRALCLVGVSSAKGITEARCVRAALQVVGITAPVFLFDGRATEANRHAAKEAVIAACEAYLTAQGIR